MSGLLYGEMSIDPTKSNPFITVFRSNLVFSNSEIGSDLLQALQPVCSELVEFVKFGLKHLDNPLKKLVSNDRNREDIQIKVTILFQQILHKKDTFVMDKASMILQYNKLILSSELPDNQNALTLLNEHTNYGRND